MKKAFILFFTLLILLASCVTTDYEDFYNLGMKALYECDYEQAVLYFDNALELNPDMPDAYIGRAKAYEGLGEYEKAASDYEKATELDNSNSEAYIGLADMYEKLGEVEKAEEIRRILHEQSGESELPENDVEDNIEDTFDEESVNETEITFLSGDKISLPVAVADDGDMIRFVSENIEHWSHFRGYLSMGAYFDIDYSSYIVDGNGKQWFPVNDELVMSIEDLREYWYKYFSDTTDADSYLTEFSEFDGVLYSSCPGVGGYPHCEYRLDTVKYTEQNRAIVSGYIDIYDLEGFELDHTDNIMCVLYLTDYGWMCEDIIQS